jgi:hypothetical protein
MRLFKRFISFFNSMISCVWSRTRALRALFTEADTSSKCVGLQQEAVPHK